MVTKTLLWPWASSARSAEKLHPPVGAVKTMMWDSPEESKPMPGMLGEVVAAGPDLWLVEHPHRKLAAAARANSLSVAIRMIEISSV